MNRNSAIIILFGLLLPTYGWSENSVTQLPSGSSSTVTDAPVANQARLIGGVELRPSWTSAIGEMHSENWAQLGYQTSATTQFYYRQEFNTNLSNPGSSTQGLGLFANEGSLRAKVKDFYRLSSSSTLSYEGRLYLPTLSVKREAGMVTALRNQLKVTQSLGSSTLISIEEIPILHVYNRPGNVNSRGVEANPIFENRLSLAFEFKPTRDLKLIVPLMLHNVRFRAFQAGAKNNDSWSHKLWIYPELTYTFSSNMMVGLAYYSDNLVLADLSRTQVPVGLEKGITQLIFNTSL